MENLTNGANNAQSNTTEFTAINGKQFTTLTEKSYKKQIKERLQVVTNEKKAEEGSLYGIINRLYRLNTTNFKFAPFFKKDVKDSKTNVFKLLGYLNLNEAIKYGLTNHVGFSTSYRCLSELTKQHDLGELEQYNVAMLKAGLLSESYKRYKENCNGFSTLSSDLETFSTELDETTKQLETVKSWLLKHKDSEKKPKTFEGKKSECEQLEKTVKELKTKILATKEQLNNFETESYLAEYILEIFEIFKPAPKKNNEYKFSFPVELMFKINPLSIVYFMRMVVGTGKHEQLVLKYSEVENCLKSWLKKELDKTNEPIKVTKGQFELLRFCNLTTGRQFEIEELDMMCSKAVLSELFETETVNA